MVIETIIRTPQHKNGKVFDFTVQRGRLSTVTWVFEPLEHITGSVGMHKVQFTDENQYLTFKL